MQLGQIINKALTERKPVMTTTDTKYTCKVCGRSDFKNVLALANHTRVVHPKPKAKLEPGTEKLTATMMMERYPKILKRMSHLGTAKAFAQHPDWEALLLGRGEPRQTMYDAINQTRHGKRYWLKDKKEASADRVKNHPANKAALAPVPRPVGRPPGSRPVGSRGKDKDHRLIWSQEQYDLARQIMNDPQWRKKSGTGRHGNKSVAWEAVFAVHPEWAQTLDYNTRPRNIFMSFASRVRKGSNPYGSRSEGSLLPVEKKGGLLRALVREQAQVQTNGSGAVEILGQKYELMELEKIIKAHADALIYPKHCPGCGLPLHRHVMAYRIARQHQQSEV